MQKSIVLKIGKLLIDLMVAMVVDELAEEMRLDPTDLLSCFITSRTGRLLYDESSKLWWSGPSDIAEMYKVEWKNAEVRCGL